MEYEQLAILGNLIMYDNYVNLVVSMHIGMSV